MKNVIALDIGGTNTRCALVEPDTYQFIKDKINPTVVGNLDMFLSSVAKVIDETVTPKEMENVAAISAGVPGRVRWDGYIYALPNIHIEAIPLAAYLSKRYNKPVFVRNDAEVAALAEANRGPFAKLHSLYFVTISTGIGGALTIDGKLVNSSYEVGHTMAKYHGEIHELEHMASGTGIRKLCEMNRLSVSSSKEFFELVKNGYEPAKAIYRDWIKMLSEFFLMNQANFEPDVFTLTGGVMKSSDIFLEDLRLACPGCRIERCGFDQAAGLVGAAIFGFQNV